MELIHEPFDFNGQLKTIDGILAVSADKVQKYNYIPSQDEIGDLRLFVAVCSAVHLRAKLKKEIRYNEFGQIENSNQTTELTFRQRVMVQQSFINIMREHGKCFDFMFYGDEMTCILDTTFQNEIDELLEQLAKVNSMMNILSKKSQLAGLSALEWGMGVHYGNSFVAVQRILSNDTRFNWSGSVFQLARFLSEKAIDNAPNTIYSSDVFYNNLKDKYKELMRKDTDNIYKANIINKPIKDWQTENLDK